MSSGEANMDFFLGMIFGLFLLPPLALGMGYLLAIIGFILCAAAEKLDKHRNVSYINIESKKKGG